MPRDASAFSGFAVDDVVYPKPDHQPAAFTILNSLVEDIESLIEE